MYQASYQEVYELAVHKRNTEGFSSASAYLQDMVVGTTGELRGMIMSILAESFAMGGSPQAYSDALSHYADALELVTSPANRFQILACAMGVCVDARCVRKGLRYGIECETIHSLHADIPVRWLAVYQMNNGRLSLLAQDYEDACQNFSDAASNFRATGNGFDQEALNGEVFLAEALMHVRRLEEARELCRKVRPNAKSPLLINHLNIVEGRIAIRMGDLAAANRLATRAVEATVGVLGDKDARYFVQLISLLSDIVERENPAMASDILQFLVQKVAVSSRVDLSEVLTGRLKE